jgi:hypothetical protein
MTNALAGAALILSLVGCGGSNPPADGEGQSIQSPDDATGGYMQATVAPGMGTVRATIYDAAGKAVIASFVADAPGAALSFWWTSAPGQQTRVALRDDGGASYSYDLTSSYTPVADTYEPNDATGAATPMPADGQMSAFLFAGRRDGTNDPAAYDDYYRFAAQPGALSIRLDNVPADGQMSAFLFAGRRDGTNDPAAYDDYYRFAAQPGALSIRLDDVPADVAARLFLLRADGTEVARVSNGMRGAALALSAPAVTDAGDFIVRVALWAETPAAAGAGTDLPASFTQPYRLTVSQAQP